MLLLSRGGDCAAGERVLRSGEKSKRGDELASRRAGENGVGAVDRSVILCTERFRFLKKRKERCRPTFFSPLYIASQSYRPARPEGKTWEFTERVITDRLTHLLGQRIGPRVRQLQRRLVRWRSTLRGRSALTT